jgi:hypothetical protein
MTKLIVSKILLLFPRMQLRTEQHRRPLNNGCSTIEHLKGCKSDSSDSLLLRRIGHIHTACHVADNSHPYCCHGYFCSHSNDMDDRTRTVYYHASGYWNNHFKELRLISTLLFQSALNALVEA